ncbi:MAG TPA: DNA methyltransferase [Gemmataceae bacterium]
MKKQKANKYQVMRPHTAAERSALKEAIRHAGRINVPIVEDEHGNIIDGYTRDEILRELTAEGEDIHDPERDIRYGLTEGEKRSLARSLNAARRHLSTAERRQLIDDQLKDTADRSDRQIADLFGVDHKTVAARREHLIATGEIPQLNATTGADGKTRKARRGSIHARDGKEAKIVRESLKVLTPDEVPNKVVEARRVMGIANKKIWREKRKQKPPVTFDLDNIDLRVGDCREVLNDLAPGSVKLIITDPPWDKAGVYEQRVYDLCGLVASRLLHPDGLAFVYHSSMYFVQSLVDVASHLEEQWPFALVHQYSTNKVHEREVFAGFRPIQVWKQKGSTRQLGFKSMDVIIRPGRPEKEHHRDQQGLAETVDLVRKFSEPGDSVCDMFMGSGTVAEACRITGRRFVGCDIVPGHVETAIQRCLECQEVIVHVSRLPSRRWIASPAA